MRMGPNTEVTFVPGHHGRDGLVVLWDSSSPPDTAAPRPHRRTMVMADGPHEVATDEVEIGDAIDHLATLTADAPVTASGRAWAVATRLALDLVGRGRLLPGTAEDGTDVWRVGPLDPQDRANIAELADALPAAAHAVEPATVPTPPDAPLQHGDQPRLLAPDLAVIGFLDAVADRFVRTAAAPDHAGSAAYAGLEPTDVRAAATWLRSVSAAANALATPGLRMELPAIPDDPVRCVLQIRSRFDHSLVLDAAALWTAPEAVVKRFGEGVEHDVLVTLAGAARVWAPVGRLLDQVTPDALTLADAEVEDLFGPVADDLAAAGLPVLWPAEVFRTVEVVPEVLAAAEPGVEARPASLDLRALGEMRWRATIDGADLTDDELVQLAEAKRPVVRLRDGWVRADPVRLRQVAERAPLRGGEVAAAALTGTLHHRGHTFDTEVTGALADLRDRLGAIAGAGPAAEPPGLEAELRPYQRRGLGWLSQMSELGLGGVLADDMGLGKTIQVLALHLQRVVPGPTLVVCPASVLGNWEREAARFAPGVPVHRYHGTERNLVGLPDDAIVTATYGVVRRDRLELADVDWGLVVADEAQAVKNPRAQAARALRAIPARARLALTGTPVENRLRDLWALLDWTTPGLLGTAETFQARLATPIEREGDEEAMQMLDRLVQPFVLRRRKIDPDIAPELPPKTETDRFVGLTVEQATLYKAAVDELLDDVRGATGIQRRGRVLRLLTALKQICNHPAQYLGQDDPLPGRSGKFDAVDELVETVLDEGESVLVFTQYVTMGRLLHRHFRSLDRPAAFLHGGTPVATRPTLVDDFQNGPPTALVVSLRAGGTGLNLTRATHVVHFDRWWNPAVEDQASDRAWRIGQTRPVQVHRMMCEGTLEERIAALIDAKRSLADRVVRAGETWLSELADDDVAALVDLTEPTGGPR